MAYTNISFEEIIRRSTNGAGELEVQSSSYDKASGANASTDVAPALFTTAYTLSVNAAVATGDGAALNVRNFSKVGAQIVIAGTATAQLWGSLNDGTTYSQIFKDAYGNDITSITATAIHQLNGKYTHVRGKVSAWTSGAVSVHLLGGN